MILKIMFFVLALCSHPLYAKDRPDQLKGGDLRQIREAFLTKYFGFVYIKDDDQLEKMKKEGQLVPIPDELRIDPRLDPKFHFVTKTTALYLTKLHKDFMDEFKTPFQINSAVRTVVYQNELRLRNKNAAPTGGIKISSHLTGGAVDIAKLGLTPQQIIWLRKRLVADKKQGTIEAVEEMHQAVFHIMVFKKEDK